MTPKKCQLINVGVGSLIPYITFRGEIFTDPEGSIPEGGIGEIVFNGEPISSEVRTTNAPTHGVIIVEQLGSEEMPMTQGGVRSMVRVIGDTCGGIEWAIEEGM